MNTDDLFGLQSIVDECDAPRDEVTVIIRDENWSDFPVSGVELVWKAHEQKWYLVLTVGKVFP